MWKNLLGKHEEEEVIVVKEAVEVMLERDVACKVVLELIGGMYKSLLVSSSVMLGWGKNQEELHWRRDICNAKSI
jgi:hypothetical protein